ncbi:unnamed protein product [Medioppia subpectinata]|uniref:CCZ1/INTU second Longin domain-containing protein n=1 Tax=Medioppia subpectinata TaxID=1979941 RepID=A0A7R9PXG2_9ACAR|nr:unnamed protein product [Medioppia subpectinata]CAG2104355.1 unnamed protein product [Medioppia subpectinata]
MSSESESSCCSTCSSSDYESSLSDITLNDEDMDYANQLTHELFYLKLIAEDKHNHKLADECHLKDKDTQQKTNQLNERIGLQYNRFTSWVFPNKSSKQSTDKSLKRKSSRKKEVTNVSKEAIVSNDTNCAANPVINVSDCDDNGVNEVIKTNKLFDLIDGKTETMASKGGNHLVLMYLMPPNDTQTDCLLYSYPKTENEDSNQVLAKLKGMFITLSQVVSQITKQSICLSSIAVNQQNGEQLYRIGFVHQMDSLLVLALPYDKYTDIEVEAMVQTIARVIKFIYSSLDAAFKDQLKHENLTKLFSTFEYLLAEEFKYSSIDSIFLNTIKRLIINDNLAINLSDSLSEFEAMDWISDNSTIDLHQQNSSQLIVIGSCLLYKGLLLSSQLSVNHLKDIFAFLSLKGLLSLHKTNSIRLVYWSEVFPNFNPNIESNDYNESDCVKYFVSMVGFQHMIHCTLIEMPFISAEETPIKANEVLINESIRLLKWHFTKMGIIDEIDHCFNVQQMAVKHMFGQNKEQKRYKSLSSLKDLLFQSPGSSQSRSHMYHSNSSLSTLSGSSLSASIKSNSSPSLHHSVLSRTSSSATSLSKDMHSMACNENCIYLEQTFKMPENLICYLDIEDGQQVFAGPLLQWPKDICEQIFKKFADSCYEMSRHFRQSVDLCHEIGRSFQIKISSNFLNPNKLRSKKAENEIHLFNVIARHEKNNEFYACFKTNPSDSLFNDFDIEDFIYSLHLQRRLL